MNIHQQFCKVWFDFYRANKGIKYRMTARDENHLKNIRRALIDQLEEPPLFDGALVLMFNTFLLKIKNQFVLDRLTLSVVDSMFNQLWQEQHASRFPNTYIADFEKKLEPQDVINYQKHLRKLGWTIEPHPIVGTTYKPPTIGTIPVSE